MYKDMPSIKKQIFIAAAKLFSDRGYHETHLTDIAEVVGINKASIYNHFKSKHDILTGLFAIYEEQRCAIIPDLGELLDMAKAEPVMKVIKRLDYHFSPSLEPLMHDILWAAIQCIKFDKCSERFIMDNVFTGPMELIKPVLSRLVELGRIEPVDIEAVCNMLRHYCFSYVSLTAAKLSVDVHPWKDGLKFLYHGFIKETER